MSGETLVSEGIDANYMDMINYSVFGLIKIEFGDRQETYCRESLGEPLPFSAGGFVHIFRRIPKNKKTPTLNSMADNAIPTIKGA